MQRTVGCIAAVAAQNHDAKKRKQHSVKHRNTPQTELQLLKHLVTTWKKECGTLEHTAACLDTPQTELRELKHTTMMLKTECNTLQHSATHATHLTTPQTELQQLKHKIRMLKEELGHFGVPEIGVRRLDKLAWDATKTDFTSAEQEERKLLLLKVCVRECECDETDFTGSEHEELKLLLLKVCV